MSGSDPERQRCYEVEHMVAHLSDEGWLGGEYRFGDIDAVARYVRQVFGAHPGLRGIAPPAVRARRGSGSAHYEARAAVIAIPDRADDRALGRWAMRSLVVDHEIAHHVAAVRHGDARHGPAWRACFVDVVRFTAGPDMADALAGYFGAAGLPLAVSC